MDAAPSIASYDWPGGREALLRFGPHGAPTVIVAPPLFEEANRTRALIVRTLRLLAAHGIGGALPDIPGQGESERDLAGIRVATWRVAFAAAVAAVGHGAVVVAIRGGTLIDAEATASARIHLAPVAGRVLIRDLLRARRVAALAAGQAPAVDESAVDGPPLLLAGNTVDRALLRDLMAAEPGGADHILPVFSASGAADRALGPRFPAPWSASEPFADPDLAAMLASEIAARISSCGG